MNPISIGTKNNRTRSFQNINIPILRATIIDTTSPVSDPIVKLMDAPIDPYIGTSRKYRRIRGIPIKKLIANDCL